MVRRHDKKSKYLRGWRRHGKGNVKNKRGAGNRGGRGNAGLKKHKFTYAVKYLKDHFGGKGFVPIKKKAIPVVNLWQIENFIKAGSVEKDGDLYVFNFDGKILGSGSLSYAVVVRARAFTDKAKKKIEESGGRVETLG